MDYSSGSHPLLLLLTKSPYTSHCSLVGRWGNKGLGGRTAKQKSLTCPTRPLSSSCTHPSIHGIYPPHSVTEYFHTLSSLLEKVTLLNIFHMYPEKSCLSFLRRLSCVTYSLNNVASLQISFPTTRLNASWEHERPWLISLSTLSRCLADISSHENFMN